jgi:hypothetical protein
MGRSRRNLGGRIVRGRNSLCDQLGKGQVTRGFVEVERLRDRMCQSPPESFFHFAERTAPRGGAARYSEGIHPTSSLAGSLKNQVSGQFLWDRLPERPPV